MPTLTVVSGNPRPGSRTLQVARRVAATLDPGAAVTETELADLAPLLFRPESAPVERAVHQLAASELAVVATPSYKGSFTGLLKAFLDQVPTGGLSGVTVVPTVVAASTPHLVRTELQLADVLTELGADLLPGCLVGEHQLGTLDAVLGDWHGSLLAAEVAG